MDKQMLAELIEESRHGNEAALKQLLIYAHTPVFWLCRRLLNEAESATEMTGRVLNTLAHRLDQLDNPERFLRWLGTVTAERCMRKRAKQKVPEYESDAQDTVFPNKELNKAQTAHVVQILADHLAEEHRLCLILSACCRVGTNDIARMMGCGEETVLTRLREAEKGIQEQLRLYQTEGVKFAGTVNVAGLLRYAMLLEKDPAAAVAAVGQILPSVAPAPQPIKPPVQASKDPVNLMIPLLGAAAILFFVLMLLIIGVVAGRGNRGTGEDTVPTAEAVTEQTEAAQTEGESTMETTVESTAEPVTEPITEPTEEETAPPETTPETTQTAAVDPPKTAVPKKPAQNTAKPPAGVSDSGNSGPESDPDYDPGRGEDGHTHVFRTVPAPGNVTCSRGGRIYRLCTLCSFGIETEDPARPALGHDYQPDRVIPPTTTSKGYTIYKCTRCSGSYDADFVDPLPAPAETQPVVTDPPAETPTPPPEALPSGDPTSEE